MLLLSLQLHNLEWWQRAIEGGVGPALLNAPPPLFDAQEVAPLLRAILTEAWSAARGNVFAASLLFGMTPAVAKTLVSLTAQTIDRIVTTQATAVRPRWEESRTFWNGLLETAVAEDGEALMYVHLHALQLMGRRPSLVIVDDLPICHRAACSGAALKRRRRRLQETQAAGEPYLDFGFT